MASQPTLAELPVVGYPTSSLFGRPGLTPQIQQGMQQSASVAKPVSKQHVLLIAAAAIIGGYVLFHWNEVR